MSTPAFPALVVEDNPTDQLLLREALNEGRQNMISVTTVETLEACLAAMDRCRFRVILADLGLPDSFGLETLAALQSKDPEIPIIVLTALDDEEIALKAVQMGAQDYLIKGQMQPLLIGRLIRYAVERHHLQRELLRKEELARQEREVRSMEVLSQLPGTNITAEMYQGQSVRESYRAEFDSLVGRYRALLDVKVDQRIYKSPAECNESLRDIGEELGFLRASPRDVIEMHTAALRSALVEGAKAQAYLEEARIVALELMGHLAAYYRYYSTQRVPKVKV